MNNGSFIANWDFYESYSMSCLMFEFDIFEPKIGLLFTYFRDFRFREFVQSVPILMVF